MRELSVNLFVAQPPERVFAAFADPFQVRRWYGAPPGCHRTGADGEVAPGEQFRVNLLDAKGAPFAQTGTILAVEPGESLELEMAWEGGDLGQEATRASIALRPVDGGTRLEVRQGPFSSRVALEAHRAYWEFALGRLARVSAGEAVPCFEEFWEESRGFVGPLAAAAYTVLAGLRESGAPPEAVAQVEETLYAHLARLPKETSEVLGAVLRARLNDASS
jgi:uncharacterized protein YndB with AHSA1/START domain